MPNLPLVLTQGALTSDLGTLIGTGSYNGFSWGPGTQTLVSSISGVHDLPPIRTYDSPRGLDDGQWSGFDELDARDITLEFQVRGNPLLTDDVSRFNDAMNTFRDLQKAFVRTDTELPLYLFNSTRFANVRARKRALVYEAGYIQSVLQIACAFHATDPRIYDAITQYLTLTPALATGGRTYLKRFPYTYPGTVSGTPAGNVCNFGNYNTKAVITIQGSCTNPSIQNNTSGQHLTFNTTLNATDTLVIDTDVHTAVLNGTASRRATLSLDSAWWKIAPGTSTIQFSASTPGSSCTATIAYASAWV